MYILYGQSIENGMTFIGPYDTEAEAREAQRLMDYDEIYEDIAMQYEFTIIELHESIIIAQSFDKTMTQVL